jgi:hypothetical protein
MDSPDSVSRVSAPSTIMKKIIAATAISQLRTEAKVCMDGGPCAKAAAPSSGNNVARWALALRGRATLFNRFARERIPPPPTRIFQQ